MPLMHAVQVLLSLDGALRLVWAGDNADDEPNGDPSLYFGVQPHHFVRIAELLHRDCRESPNMSLPDPERRNVFGVICNLDKRAYLLRRKVPFNAEPPSSVLAGGGEITAGCGRDRAGTVERQPPSHGTTLASHNRNP